MAEDNIGFDPLEALGNDYGNINGAGLDNKSFQPFEGDRINENKINFEASERFYPITPAVSNLTRNNLQIQKTVNDGLTNTPAAQKNNNPLTAQEKLDMKGKLFVAKAEASQNKDEYAKMYAYDASSSGNSFYKRYAAYGQEKFDAIGFHPLRDNEANFNSRTTKWDDWSRMMNHSFWPLFGKGFKSGPASLAKLVQGDFSSDTVDASEYEEAAAIGQSTKGGIFGFVNNTALNFGYTAGIITEAIAEELVGALLAVPTGGASLFAATANNLRKGITIAKGIDKGVDGMKAVNQTIESLKTFNSAKSFWSASKLGHIINPLDNTFAAIRGIKQTDNITNLAKISKTAGGFYRDVRNLNMALAEGRLEAGMVQNHVYDKLYDEYYTKNGEPPSDQEQQYMRQQSKEASANTLFWNTGLIYLSNKITFDNITGPRGGLRNFMKSTVDDVVSVGGGKFGNIGKVVYDKSKKAFEFKKNNIKELAKSWWKNPGFKTAAKTIGYMKGNFSEGIQENLQEVIARTNERYYIDTFNSRGRRSHEYAKGVLNISQGDYFKEELRAEFSAQGFETFASGFVMGMPAGVLNNAIPFLSTSYNRIFNKDSYQEYKDNKLKITEGIVESLNKIDIKDFLNTRAFNYGAQDILAEIKQSGTKKEALDAEIEVLVGALQTMIGTNTTDIFIEKLQSYNELSDDEFIDAMDGISKEDVPKYRERVNESIAKIERVKKRFDFYDKKMPNPIKNSDLEELDPTSEEYANAVSLQKGWDNAVYNAVYFNESFEDSMTRMVAIQNKFLSSTLLKNTGQKEMNLLFQPDKLQGEVEMLSNEIKLLESAPTKTEADKKKIKDKKKILSTLTSFKESHLAFDQFYNRSDYYQTVKANLTKTNGGTVPTEAEINKAIDDKLGALDDENKQTKLSNDLKISFNEYIKHIASIDNDTVFDETIDESFTLLLDHYKLGVEARQMIKYINTLHDPNNFADLARRNQQWMRDIYNSRPEYYEAMVKQEIEDVENNALLNKLASKNIYISQEAFIKWKEEGTLPTEFFNNSTKKVVPVDSNEYAMYVMIFQHAANLQEEEENIANKIYTKEVTEKIEAANVKEQEELDALPKIDVKKDVRALDKKRKKHVLLSTAVDQLKDKEYFVAEHVVDGEPVEVIFYKDGDKIKRDNIEGEEVNIAEDKFKYVSGIIYSITQEADPLEIQKIKDKYTKIRRDLGRSSKAEPVSAEPVTTETPVEELEPELYNQLYTLFFNTIENDPDYTAELNDDILFDLALGEFIKTDTRALQLIKEYNGEILTFGQPPVSETTDIEKEAPITPTVEDTATPILNQLLGKIAETQEEEVIEEKQITIKEVDGKMVSYKGKPYQVKKEGVRFILESENTIIELEANENTTLQDLNIEYNQGVYYKPTYEVTIKDENAATVNDVDYILNTDTKGNITSVSPVNRPAQKIKNAKLLIDVEIARNKHDFKEAISTEKEFTYKEELEELEAIDPKAHEKIVQVESVYNKNWNDTVESALSNLYSKKELSAEEKLALDLWVTDAIINITKIYNKTQDPIYGKALDNLEIINTLLYEGYTQQPTETSTDESTKTRYVKPTEPVKKEEAEESISEVELVEEEVKEESERLIAIKDIIVTDKQGKTSIFTAALTPVIVSKLNVKKGTVTLTPLGKTKGRQFNINELDQLFKLESQIMEETLTESKVEPTITSEEKIILNESNDVIDIFLEDISRQKEIENRAEKRSIEDLDNDILNDLDC